MRNTLGALLLALLAISALAEESYSPDAFRDYPTRVYWGDTHVHTSYSTGDANLIGLNEITPTVAYRFAQGETVRARNGMMARIRRPLDFLVIADHAESLGIAAELKANDPEFPDSEAANTMREALAAYRANADSNELYTALRAAARVQLNPVYRKTLWQRVVKRAEEFNAPGKFTTFAGYEWSSPGSVDGVFGNLHRVVIFADNADKTSTITPFSAHDSRNPQNLWAFLQNYKKTTGGDVIAIPHNPNLSNGEMFARHQYDGSDLTKDWVKLRSEIEPLVEITQQKGDSEAHPVLSPTDEHADFETWHSWAGKAEDPTNHRCCAARKDPNFDAAAFKAQKQGEYVRAALKTGLDLAEAFGINPFQYGIIGSTDTHVSFPSADNENYWAQYPTTPPSATRPMDRFVPTWERPLHWETAASGYAAVWATENTRDALFEAMKRREVYATTGPRITVRVFAGWDFTPEDAHVPNLARRGYAKGIPMGGELSQAPAGKSATFLLGAMRDPDGAHLERIQVIKGWRDTSGQLHEKVYDAAISKDAGQSTVNIKQASYQNTIGQPELHTVWQDPDFDAGERAFYYIRVLEIPTPRWPAYDAKYFNAELADEVVTVTQERAYTSPVWYTP
ncbi:MAG: DUF3604 domain-containing protein [Pseudomonadota bacterium]